MDIEKIAFISSRRRGITADMRLINDALLDKDTKYNFEYYTKNERTKNSLVKQGVLSSKKEFYNTAEHVICIDGSLPNEKLENTDSKRVLFAIPYDYQFKQAMAKNTDSKIDNFVGFSHIYVNSPFTAKLLKSKYDLHNIIMVDGLCTPLAWNINQDNQQSAKKKTFAKFYPGCQGKKVCSILFSKQIAEEQEDIEFDLKEFIGKLGSEEWFVLTNSKAVLDKAVSISAKYKENFGYIGNVIPVTDLLYFTDMLISNDAYLMTTFVSTRKPFFCISYKETNFEKYVKKHYPDLWLADFNKLLNEVVVKALFTDAHKKFREEFSYEVDKNPCDSVKKLLLEK